MSNKFLSIYPQLWEPKIGDQVRVIKIIDGAGIKRRPIEKAWVYKIGDIGIIQHFIIDKFSRPAYRIAFNSVYDSKPVIKVFHLLRDEIELYHGS